MHVCAYTSTYVFNVNMNVTEAMCLPFNAQSELEKTLDETVEKGDLEKASAISDHLASRELACRVATAFDCVDYVKRCKVCSL